MKDNMHLLKGHWQRNELMQVGQRHAFDLQKISLSKGVVFNAREKRGVQ
jgi:hypothetical protein